MENVKKSIVVISLSGGLDSTSLMLKLLADNNRVFAVSFNYGQRHNIELERVAKNIEYLKAKGYEVEYTNIDISILGKMFDCTLTNKDSVMPTGHYAEENMKDTVVPNRNAIFSSMVYGYALALSKKFSEPAYISLGIHSGDHAIYPDCRAEFRDALELAFKMGNWDSENVSYYTPYVEGDKFTILKDAEINCAKLGLDFNVVFGNTNTCYNPDKEGKSCGECGSCQERLLAFDKLNRMDPVEYQKDYKVLIENAFQNEVAYQSKSNEAFESLKNSDPTIKKGTVITKSRSY